MFDVRRGQKTFMRAGGMMKSMTSAAKYILLIFFWATPAYSLQGGENLKDPSAFWAVNAIGTASILSYGAVMWEYGENAPHVRPEGWFGEDTKHGGADKTGHAFTGYFLARTGADLYGYLGYSESQASGMGAMTSILLTTTMEIGDSFSEFGLSPQDIYANIAGAALGYALSAYPKAGRFIDYRVEYSPSLTRPDKDPTTDYQHLKYILAFRFSGFESLEDSPLRFINLMCGYYTRGFGSGGEGERSIFWGMGLDLAELFSGHSVSMVFNYLQPPYTHAGSARTF